MWRFEKTKAILQNASWTLEIDVESPDAGLGDLMSPDTGRNKPRFLPVSVRGCCKSNRRIRIRSAGPCAKACTCAARIWLCPTA
jgi:hypothetical protein